MTRKLLLALVLALTAPAQADTFTAAYSELARATGQSFSASWFSGAVTKDNKFIYGMGDSHASFGNNSLWAYDPATNTHANLFPETGYLYRSDKDAAGNPVPKSGRWAKLDPVANKALYTFFGGPDIVAMTNRNNHQAFYMPGFPRYAATFDPATKLWTPLNQGAGWGNGGVLHSSGKLILMGGGINGPADVNKQVWVGTLGELLGAP